MTWLPANSTSPALITFFSLVSQYFGNSYDDLFIEPRKNISVGENEYDFIIVGAGSAGSVVANRLSEEPKWKILLLEGGDEEPIVADVPGILSYLLGSSIDYGYTTLPEPTGSEFGDRKPFNVPRGKVMGGTSTINGMQYVRGSREDYNDWAKSGNEGWSWEDVLPYFKKSEDARDEKLLESSPGYHSKGGYLTVEPAKKQREYFPAFTEAWKELGMKEIDYNTGDLVGFGRVQYHMIRGSRASSNGAFIRPIRGKRTNLLIKTKSRATKIVFDKSTKKAIGVEYEITNGNTTTIKKAFASKEVVVSAGVIDSPKLLMLSGVGPKEDLQNLNIQVVKDLPVGHNLHNHIDAPAISFEVNINITSVNSETMWNDFIYWMSTREGYWAMEGIQRVGHQTKFEKRQGVADINLNFESSEKKSSNETSESDCVGIRVITIYPVLLDPRSRGYVKLNKDDPIRGNPEIQMNYLTDSRDVNVLIEGLKFARKLRESKALKKWRYQFIKAPKAGCENLDFESDSYLECVIKKYLGQRSHNVGTCKMGRKTDNSAVVDSELKVHGLDGLRVIDASIMPHVTKGNTFAPTVMIGEKGSDMIKNTWLPNF